jgi:hypothetical protein
MTFTYVLARDFCGLEDGCCVYVGMYVCIRIDTIVLRIFCLLAGWLAD